MQQRQKGDGTLTESFSETAELVLKHFAAVEAAECLELSDMASRYNCTPVRSITTHEAANVPTLGELTRKLAALRRDKAPSQDQIDTTMLAAQPAKMAEILHPLMVKVACQAQEPFDWKGGIAHDLWKLKGSPYLMDMYRSILLASTVGKVWHSFLRGRLLELGRALYRDSQIGGFANRGVDMGLLTLRSLAGYAKAKQRSSAILFVDVKSAYYTVLKQLIVPCGITDEDAHEALSLDIPVAARHALLESLRRPSILEEHIVDKHLLAQVADASENHWFSVRGTTQCARPRRGTRPGDPLADLLFSALAARILDAVAAKSANVFNWTQNRGTSPEGSKGRRSRTQRTVTT